MSEGQKTVKASIFYPTNSWSPFCPHTLTRVHKRSMWGWSVRFRSLTFHALMQINPVVVPVIKVCAGIQGTGRTRKNSQCVDQSESRTALTHASAQWRSVPTARTTYDLSTSVKCPPSMRTLSWTFSSDTIASKCRQFGSRRLRSCPEASHLYNVPFCAHRRITLVQSAMNVSVCCTRFWQASHRFTALFNDTRRLHTRIKKRFVTPLLQNRDCDQKQGLSPWLPPPHP